MEKRKDESLIGKIFFKTYKVKKMLGEGSFGKIYNVYNINTKEEFAVKLVSKNNNSIMINLIIFRKKKILQKVF
jgi:serine/threonine protein kinase